MLCVYYPYCQLYVSCVQGKEVLRESQNRILTSSLWNNCSYAVWVASWLNALAATLDLDGVKLGLGGDGHGGGDVDAKKNMFKIWNIASEFKARLFLEIRPFKDFYIKLTMVLHKLKLGQSI